MKNNSFLKSVKNGERLSGYARILKKRDFGKMSFWKVRFCEDEIQLLVQKRSLNEYDEIKKIGLGSLIFIEGKKMVTKTEEPSIDVDFVRVEKEGSVVLQNKLSGINHLSKSGDRILDIISSKNLFDYLLLISRITREVRSFLEIKGFNEFSTGILQKYFEGGQAEPFQTVCRNNGDPLYLSLTSELKLKRLMVAGFEKVYELSQSFRNEGIDRMHLPEFTLLELYAVNQDYSDMMELTEQMVCSILNGVGRGVTFFYDKNEIIFHPPFARRTFDDLCLEFLGLPGHECNSDWLAVKYPDIFHSGMNEFTWIMKLVDKVFTPNIMHPTFLTDIPSGISPFAKKNTRNNKLSESAFFVAMGINIATISTDENDVSIIKPLLEEQSEKTGRPVNQDYLNVLSFGLPKTAGVGFGLNRFFMIFQEGKKSAKETCVLPVF